MKPSSRYPNPIYHTVGVLFFVVSLFQVVALGAHRGWAEGSVVVRTDRDTPLVPASCPDELTKVDPQASCLLSQRILSTSRTALAFGLFRSLSYSTQNSSEWTSNLYVQVNASQTRLVQSTVDYETADPSTIIQHSYRTWAQGNPSAMANVTSAQVFNVLAWWLTTASWVLLVVGLHYTRSKRKSEARLKLSSYLLLGASACLFLCFSVWAGMPSQALTNMCVEGDDDGAGVTCTQLLSAPCEALLAEDPSAVCSASGSVNKRAGLWGLIFLSWMVELMAAFFLGRLHEAIVMSEGTTPREEPLLGDLVRAGASPRASQMPTAIVS